MQKEKIYVLDTVDIYQKVNGFFPVWKIQNFNVSMGNGT